MNPLPAIFTTIEELLANFYGFELQANVSNHLISEAETQGDARYSPITGQGQVIIEATSAEDFFIGVKFSDSILKNLAELNPLSKLSTENLNSFCVAVEEVSHFHLILNRMERQQSVTHLELEWQAEIDKLLLTSHILSEQSSNHHLDALKIALFDRITFTAANIERYRLANKLAVQVWDHFDKLRVSHQNPFNSTKLKTLLRASYNLNFENKLIKFNIAV